MVSFLWYSIMVSFQYLNMICFQVKLRARVKRGDGVAFDAGMPEEKEEGGLVYEVMG